MTSRDFVGPMAPMAFGCLASCCTSLSDATPTSAILSLNSLGGGGAGGRGGRPSASDPAFYIRDPGALTSPARPESAVRSISVGKILARAMFRSQQSTAGNTTQGKAVDSKHAPSLLNKTKFQQENSGRDWTSTDFNFAGAAEARKIRGQLLHRKLAKLHLRCTVATRGFQAESESSLLHFAPLKICQAPLAESVNQPL